MLRPLDVIVIFDGTIRPPGPKMVVAIHPALGWFYRINSKPWKPCVKISKFPDCQFLDHDSHLECGDPLELDDSIVDDAVALKGVIARLPLRYIPAILDHLAQAAYTSKSDRDQITAVLMNMKD